MGDGDVDLYIFELKREYGEPRAIAKVTNGLGTRVLGGFKQGFSDFIYYHNRHKPLVIFGYSWRKKVN